MSHKRNVAFNIREVIMSHISKHVLHYAEHGLGALRDDPVFQSACQVVMSQTGKDTLNHVKEKAGGPFGAQLFTFNPDTGKVKLIGRAGFNAVTQKGPGAHAESEALSPHNIRLMNNELARQNKKHAETKSSNAPINPNVFPGLASTSNFCSACSTKIEIWSRYLVRKGLASKNNIFAVYGTTSRETYDHGGFYDEPYARDFLYADREKNIKLDQTMVAHQMGKLHLKTEILSLSDSLRGNKQAIPPSVHKIFKDAREPTAVVARGDDVLGVGIDLRDPDMRLSGAPVTKSIPFDLYSTPGNTAIQAARNFQDQEGLENPWLLFRGGDEDPRSKKHCVTLYVVAPDDENEPYIGPCERGVAQWAGIGAIVSAKNEYKPFNIVHGVIEMTDDPILYTRETPDASNRDFFHQMACGYNYRKSVASVFRLESDLITSPLDATAEGARTELCGIPEIYEALNLYQAMSEKGEVALYNGITPPNNDKYALLSAQLFEGDPLVYKPVTIVPVASRDTATLFGLTKNISALSDPHGLGGRLFLPTPPEAETAKVREASTQRYH